MLRWAGRQNGCTNSYYFLKKLLNDKFAGNFRNFAISMNFSISIFRFCAAALLAIVLLFPRYTRHGTEATLAWDVSGYYLYLPATFIYHDLKKVSFLPDIIEKYQPSFSPDQAFPIENGNQVMKYSAGMAVLYLPFFAIGHVIAKLGGYPADGFSLPYQASIHLGCVFMAIVGLWFLRKILLRYFPDRTVGWTLLLIALGTNFLNYATFDAANAHGCLFMLVALLTHLTIRYHDRPTLRGSAGLGTVIGLLALVRPTEVLYAIIPLLWGVNSLATLRQRVGFFIKNWPQLLLAGIATAAIGSIQLVYWKYVSGHWFVYSYGDQSFSFLYPHFMDVFFSYRKGWLVYTPLMAFALVGFWFLVKRFSTQSPIINHQSPVITIILFFLLNTWIVCAWDIWWYGGAFGQRAMIQSYPLLAFPLSAFLVFMDEKPWRKWLFGALLAGCVALNLFQTYQAHWGPWEAEAMTGAYYRRIFAKLKDDQNDKLLLDTREGFFGEKKNAKLIYSTDFEEVTDTVGVSGKFFKSGSKAVFCAPQMPFSHTVEITRSVEMTRGKWLHIAADFYCEAKIWEAWNMPQLVVRFEQQGNSIRERALRPMRVMQPGQWTEVGMDIKVPRADFDRMKIFLWCPGGQGELWVDDLKIETFED